MKTKILLLVLLFVIASGSANCEVLKITNVGAHFTPDHLIIHSGEEILFELGPNYSVVEVSQEEWNRFPTRQEAMTKQLSLNGIQKLHNGFETPYGGGLIPARKLTPGTHWYLCPTYAVNRMKGVIEVKEMPVISPADDHTMILSVFPNPTTDIVTLNIQEDLIGETYSLLDQSGRSVINGVVEKNSMILDLSRFQRGIYLLMIGDRKPFKIIKN